MGSKGSHIITASELQRLFNSKFRDRYELVAPNVYLDFEFNEMDIAGFRPSNYIDEVEIKLSKADFKADFKKTIKVQGEVMEHVPGHSYRKLEKTLKHTALQKGILHCNYFSFLMPEDLANECNIPSYAGLYVYKIDRLGRGCVSEEKRATRLHTRKMGEAFKYKVSRKMAYRYWRLLSRSE